MIITEHVITFGNVLFYFNAFNAYIFIELLYYVYTMYNVCVHVYSVTVYFLIHLLFVVVYFYPTLYCFFVYCVVLYIHICAVSSNIQVTHSIQNRSMLYW